MAGWLPWWRAGAGWLLVAWCLAGWRPAGWRPAGGRLAGWMAGSVRHCLTAVSPAACGFPFGAMLGAHLQDDQVQGAIFDIDGTLLDSMSGYFPSWEYACAKHGLTITIEQFFGYAGQPMNDIARHIYLTQKGEAAPPGFVELFMEDKEQGMKQIYVSVGLNELRI